MRRFDQSRKSRKKVSNDEWESATDSDSRIGKMKDGRYHLKYKAENAVDLETEIIVAAEVYHGDQGDTSTIEDTVNAAQTHLREAETGCQVEELVADKGYHGELILDQLQNESEVRTYIPEPKQQHNRVWTDKSPLRQASYRRNRRNATGDRGRRLQRLRSERVERTFAHLCDTGGTRRTWLRGIEKVRKRYLSADGLQPGADHAPANRRWQAKVRTGARREGAACLVCHNRGLVPSPDRLPRDPSAMESLLHQFLRGRRATRRDRLKA